MTPSNPEALPTDFLRGSVITGHVVMVSVEKVIDFTPRLDPTTPPPPNTREPDARMNYRINKVLFVPEILNWFFPAAMH